MAKILIVDDEAPIRRTLRDILEFEKYQVEEAVDGMEALVKIKQGRFDSVILDVKMPKMDGMEVLDRLQIIDPDIPVIMVSGHGDINLAVESVKKGAFDYIAKPLDLNRLLITLRNAMDRGSLAIETKQLKRKVAQISKTSDIIGETKAIQAVKETIDRVAATDARVLITGPNGSGKELVARWMHEKSSRNNGPLVEVNCAAIPSELIESELFGHMKGSFTSAVKDHAGKFEQADNGTIFLDEIGDMSLTAQAKVLRVLQEHKISRIGSDKDIKVNVRVLAATNKDLKAEIQKGNFREDLYYRLAVIIVEVPPLNERKEDVPSLVEHFLINYCTENNIPIKKIEPAAMELLKIHNWRGNIRELRNVIERLVILSGKDISAEDIKRYVLHHQRTELNKLEDLFSKFDNIEALQKFVLEEYRKFQEKTMLV